MSVYFHLSRLVSSVRCASAGDCNFLIGSLLNIALITRETRGKSRQLAVAGQLRSAHRLVRQAFRARLRTDRMAAACHEHSLARHATASSAGFLIQIREDSYYVKRLRILLNSPICIVFPARSEFSKNLSAHLKRKASVIFVKSRSARAAHSNRTGNLFPVASRWRESN